VRFGKKSLLAGRRFKIFLMNSIPRNNLLLFLLFLFLFVRSGDRFGAHCSSTPAPETWFAVSHNGGARSWRSVAVHKDGVVMAAVVRNGGVWISKNGGERWTLSEGAPTDADWFGVSIADDNPDYMIAAVVREHLYRTTDGGITWTTFTDEGVMKESTGKWPSWKGTALSADAKYQLVNSFSGHMFRSNDFGATWSKAQLGTGTNRLQDTDGNIIGDYVGGDIGAKNYYSCDMSADGKYQTAVVSNGLIYVSNDYGETFLPPFYDGTVGDNPVGNKVDSWQTVKMSEDGKYQLACVYLTGHLTLSTDYGVSWKKVAEDECLDASTCIDSLNYQYVAVSEDGRTMMAAVTNGYLLRSTDFGATWEYLTDQGRGTWTSIGMSNDGKNVLASWSTSYLYIGQYKCVSGTYGTFPDCTTCPEGTCSFGGDGTDSSSCLATSCYALATTSTGDILIRNEITMTLTLPEALPAGNELRFELYSQLEGATIFIRAADDAGSELMSDSMANNVLTFSPGETTKHFKIMQTSNFAAGLYVVYENTVAGGAYNLPNRYAIYSPKTIQARKKKIYTPVINSGTALDYLERYSFITRLEVLPSQYLLDSGESFEVSVSSSALIFRTNTGGTTITLDSASLETSLIVYGVEIGTQNYQIIVPTSSKWAEEYEPAVDRVDVDVTCGAGSVPELENTYTGAQTKKCIACPTGTVASSGAESLLDCVCPLSTVDIRLSGFLPDTYTVPADVYPCLSASLYCEKRVFDVELGEYQQCVDFVGGEPVGISKNYYRYEFDSWQLVVPGQETATLTLTDEHLTKLKPVIAVLNCKGVTCEYNATGLDSTGCLNGSIGPMCSVCEDDYFWHQDDEMCTKCSRNPDGYFSAEFLGMTLATGAIILGMAFLIVPIRDKLDEIEIFRNRVRHEFRTRFGLFKNEVASGRKELQFMAQGTTLKERLSYAPQMPDTWRYRVGQRIYNFLNDFAPKMKLLVGFVQIIVLWPESLYFVEWPKSLKSFVTAMQIFSLNFEILPIDCVVQRDYYANFFAATITPVVICVFIMLSFGIASLYLSMRDKNNERSRRYIGYGVKVCVLFLFIIYPSVSGMILQYFPCRDIGSGANYLRFSIETSCDTSKYDDFSGIVYFMLTVYVIGIPVVFLSMMSTVSYSNHFRFLLKDYKPNFWYFEIVDMIRKLFLGAVIIFVGDEESSLQLYVVVFTSMLFALILGLFKPFTRDDDNVLSQVINMEIGFIALIAIAINDGEDSLGSKSTVDGLILFAVVTVCATCIGSAFYVFFSRSSNRSDFTKYDQDMSGDLDRDELKMLLRDLKKIDSDDVCDEIFAKFDKEHVDSLDFDEFIEAGVFLHDLPTQRSVLERTFSSRSEKVEENDPSSSKKRNDNNNNNDSFMRGLSKKFSMRGV